MKAISRRICKLENRMGLGSKTEPLLVIMTRAERSLALDKDTCVRILRESGFLPGHTIGVVYLGNIPNGLDAKETEKFLRERGALICGPNAAHFD